MTFGKYTADERKIARQIYELMKVAYRYKKANNIQGYHLINQKIGMLKKPIQSKYAKCHKERFWDKRLKRRI